MRSCIYKNKIRLKEFCLVFCSIVKLSLYFRRNGLINYVHQLQAKQNQKKRFLYSLARSHKRSLFGNNL